MACGPAFKHSDGQTYYMCPTSAPVGSQSDASVTSPVTWQVGMPVPAGWALGPWPGTLQTSIDGAMHYYHANTPAHDAYHKKHHAYYSALYGGHGPHGASHYSTHPGGGGGYGDGGDGGSISIASPVGWQIGDPIPFGWAAGPRSGMLQATIDGVLKYYHANTPAHSAYHRAHHKYFSDLYGGHGPHRGTYFNVHGTSLAEYGDYAYPYGWTHGKPVPAGWSQVGRCTLRSDGGDWYNVNYDDDSNCQHNNRNNRDGRY